MRLVNLCTFFPSQLRHVRERIHCRPLACPNDYQQATRMAGRFGVRTLVLAAKVVASRVATVIALSDS
jgi:hypothetical protein